MARACRPRSTWPAAELLGSGRGTAYPAWARAAVQLVDGDVDGALDAHLSAWKVCTGSGVLMDAMAVGPRLVDAAAAAGDLGAAETVPPVLWDLHRRNPDVPSIAGAARYAEGVVSRDLDALVGAVDDCRRSTRAMPAARAAETAAVALARAGRRAEARAMAGSAVSGYREAGARYEAERARRALHAAGVPAAIGGRRTPATGPESLTRTERRVAAHVAEGLSNVEIAERLVVSRRTVESHVSHIPAKLQVASRTELILAVAHGDVCLG